MGESEDIVNAQEGSFLALARHFGPICVNHVLPQSAWTPAETRFRAGRELVRL